MESVSLASISGIIALGIVYATLPIFNARFDLNLAVGITHPDRFLFIVGIVLASGILAGFYPSIVLSGMDPVSALKKTSCQVLIILP